MLTQRPHIPNDILALAAVEEQSWPQKIAALQASGLPLNIGTTVTGTRGTGNVNQALRRIEMRREILMLEPNVTPLTVLTSQLNSTPTGSPEYRWTEDEHKPRFDAVDTTTGTGTAVRVDNATKFSVGDTVKVTRTAEVMLVTAVAAPNLTVVRGIGGAAVALVDNDELLIIGSAQPEGDTARSPRSNNPVVVNNYTQIFRDPWAATETLRHSTSNVSPIDWNHNARKTGEEHKKSMEYTFWHGLKSEALAGGANGQPLRTTGGVLSFIATNIADMGGTMTEAELFAGLSPIFRYGSPFKVAFASMLFLDVVNSFPRGKLEFVQADRDTTFGLDVRQLVTPHGTLRFVTNHQFEGAKWGGAAAVLDMKFIAKRYLANEEGSRDTHVNEHIEAPGTDGRMDEYLTEGGMEVAEERTHGLLVGVTG